MPAMSIEPPTWNGFSTCSASVEGSEPRTKLDRHATRQRFGDSGPSSAFLTLPSPRKAPEGWSTPKRYRALRTSIPFFMP